MISYICDIRNIKFRMIILINFLFTTFYYGPYILINTVYVVHIIGVTACDEINALLFFDVHDIKWPTSVDIRSIAHFNNSAHNKELLASAYNPPDQFKFIQNSFPACNKSVKMLILIKSAAENVALRQTIRVSWGQKQNNNFHLKFLLGMSRHLQPLVDSESIKYRDIIQKDFGDSYVNNTYKTIMGYDWAVRYCSNAEFILFVDDDHYVRKEAILNYVSSLPEATRETLYLGMRYVGRPKRYLGSKWYMSWSDYPYPRYPPYVAGGAYVISQSVARKFASVFPFVKYFWIDDAWVGIVAMLTGISPIADYRFYNLNYETDVEDRFILHCQNHDPAVMLAAWEKDKLIK